MYALLSPTPATKRKRRDSSSKAIPNLQCSDHFWDSTSNSNPKTGSHFIFRQKPNKLMFGVSICPDFMLTLTLHSSTSTTTTYRSSPASSLYNLPHKGILFSFLYSLLLLTSIFSGPDWHNTTKQHNPHNLHNSTIPCYRKLKMAETLNTMNNLLSPLPDHARPTHCTCCSWPGT